MPETIAHDLIVLLILGITGVIGGSLALVRHWTDLPFPEMREEEQKNSLSHTKAKADSRRAAMRILYYTVSGFAGAVIIVTLSPVDPAILNPFFVVSGKDPQQLFIKLIALGLIGGYAGASLLESSASQFLAKRVDELEERQESYQKETQRSLAAIRVAEKILRGVPLQEDEMNEFAGLINEASPTARFEIGQRADETRRQHWEIDKEPLERCLLVFRALIMTADAKRNHWWHASLGYCLKDKLNPDYSAALECLDIAIRCRGSETRSGAYEFNRAYCKIKLLEKRSGDPESRSFDREIKSDLEVAMRFPRFRSIIEQDATVQSWIHRHAIAAAE